MAKKNDKLFKGADQIRNVGSNHSSDGNSKISDWIFIISIILFFIIGLSRV